VGWLGCVFGCLGGGVGVVFWGCFCLGFVFVVYFVVGVGCVFLFGFGCLGFCVLVLGCLSVWLVWGSLGCVLFCWVLGVWGCGGVVFVVFLVLVLFVGLWVVGWLVCGG
ncbi:hypothetical protein RA274_27650, partial [Pseudomonas syringae pv. tagetis]|uniref:hypothetical protein n=1 Tax=Pseudomonas syringae group genomosp. 7 TaxID=251699 RepID=UPI0037704CBD